MSKELGSDILKSIIEGILIICLMALVIFGIGYSVGYIKAKKDINKEIIKQEIINQLKCYETRRKESKRVSK